MKYRLLSVFALTALLVSCDSDILDVENEGNYSDATYFTEAAQFNEAVIAAYSPMLLPGMYSRDYYFIFDLLGNDADKDAPLAGDLLSYTSYSHGPSSGPLYSLYRTMYKMILRSNLVIDKVSDWEPIKQEDKDLKALYIAEGQFLKSYAEFMLVRLYGDIVYKEDYEDRNTTDEGRTPAATVYANIEANLLKAVDGLPVTRSDEDYGRVTKGAAHTLLGKVYLTQGKWQDAINVLQPLTGGDFSYMLNPDFDNQFSENNTNTTETIWDVPHIWAGWGSGNAYYMFGGQEAWGGITTHTGRNMEYGWNDWRNVVVSDALVNAYTYDDEDGNSYTDPRAALTFYGDGSKGGDTDYCNLCADGAIPYTIDGNGRRWRKYNRYENRVNEGQPESEINSQVYRYADVLLMLAEAYIEVGRVSDAQPLINEVRARVGAFEYNDLGSQDEARDIVRRERRLELAGEQSRWFDLVRWGTAKEVLNAEKNAAGLNNPFQDKHFLFPFPAVERDVNPAVVVNNDWN